MSSNADISKNESAVTATNNVSFDNAGNVEDEVTLPLSQQTAPGESHNLKSGGGWLYNPGSTLLLTSVPFFAGAYFGYRIPIERLEGLAQEGTSEMGTGTPTKPADQQAIKAVAARTASRALRIATLGTVGTFGLFGAFGFYLSGYETLQDAVAGTKKWASSWGASLESLLGGDKAVSKTHPEVLATKHMKEEEELRYIYDKFIKGGENETGGDILEDANDESRPTLFTVYEKYFGKKDDE